MKVRDALNAAVREAVKAGTLDRKTHGAMIEAARKIASVMDTPGWPIVRGKIDNVSPSVFLKYCEALGFTIKQVPNQTQTKVTVEESEKVTSIGVGRSKWRKQA